MYPASSVSLLSTAAKETPDLANLRENYVTQGICEKDLPDAPHELMSKWIDDACNSKDVSISFRHILVIIHM